MTETSLPDVRKTVTVAASVEQCFAVFTGHPQDWWPPSHVLVKKERAGLAFEPGVGGRYYEWDVEGTEIAWGTVLVWEPPHRLAMTWRIDPNWQSITDDERASEIEVEFTAVDEHTTLVELAHVKLHKHGEGAERIFRALDGPSPGETLALFAKAIEKHVG
ncbi:SRPBCC family protein [Streptomyces sp. NRRL WC-3742]|uniref:SRPBCC family protein n=1 Tax=Streptomyces sp. NRRL WC-3742 TaxID=1463934 RepID=UPI00068E577B|nr:SRPBCC family protein [Streptomyces sp. NRRL WC-3742]